MSQTARALSEVEQRAVDKLARWIKRWERASRSLKGECKYGRLRSFRPDWQGWLRHLEGRAQVVTPLQEEYFLHLKGCERCFASLNRKHLLLFLSAITLELPGEEREALMSERMKQYITEHPLLEK